ncbi:MAG: hypothetical protein NTZ95_07945 [Candidatus Omnitrophica bacterium]|nr:hypothetical protein [Candidatus Omnitrophota bacterium]
MLNKVYMVLVVFVIALILYIGLYYGFTGEGLTAAVYPHKISFGERAVFMVTARSASDAEINILDGKNVLDGFVRLKEGIGPERIFLWRKRKEMWWSFTSEITGDRLIPPVAVKFIDPKRIEHSIQTEPVPIIVKSLTNLREGAIYTTRIGGDLAAGGSAAGGGGGDFRSVDGPIRIKIDDERLPLGIMDNDEILITAGACFLGVVIVYIIFSIWSRRTPRKVTIPPDKTLLMRLVVLQGRIKEDNEGQRELYYELSFSTREYLKSILHISTQEPTTKDLLDIIDKAGAIEPGKRPAYKELLNACDTMKYSASVNYRKIVRLYRYA